ncbi:MAG: hypothetical protein IT434_18140 [Phycisphaerales bacterium]|nr:hypothetical protein [Phycisphaerales bacterium]
MSREDNYRRIINTVGGSSLEQSFPKPDESSYDSWVDGLRWDDLLSLNIPPFIHAQVAITTAVAVVRLAQEHNLVLADRDMRNVVLEPVNRTREESIFRNSRGDMSVIQIDFGEVYGPDCEANVLAARTLANCFSQVKEIDRTQFSRSIVGRVSSRQYSSAIEELRGSLDEYKSSYHVLAYSDKALDNIARFRELVDSK